MTAPTAEKNNTNSHPLPADRTELIALMREVYQQEHNAAGKKVLTLDEIKQELLKLPGEEYRDYETTITGFARNWADFIIKDPDGPVQQLLQSDSEEERIAFAAFAVAVNYERLQKNPKEEGQLLEDYRDRFGRSRSTRAGGEQYEHVFFFHLDVLYRMDKAVGNSDAFLKQLLIDARINSENLTKNFGGPHAFAETVALVYENASTQLKEELNASPEHWLEKAKVAAATTIAHDPSYAKFQCTQGRIQALCGNIEEAIASINNAIAFEKNTRTDYALRIGQYSGYYQQFRAQQKLQEQEKAMAGQMREMQLAMEAQEKESMAKNMEFLGLFSGIVSFTIGSLSISGAIAEQSIRHAAGLIVVLMGALMCVFAAFGMILHGFHTVKRDKKNNKFERSFMFRHLIVFALGALVVAGGIFFCLN